MTLWYKMQFDNRIDSRREEGEIRARIRVPADSPWFDGHFPGEPVLPGIAQLGMVHDLLCRAFDQQLLVTRVSRVRFRQMIRPEQQLTLTVKRGEAAGNHPFRITGDEGSICTGQLALASGTDKKDASEGTVSTIETEKLRSGAWRMRRGRAQRRSTKMAVKTDDIILRIAEIMINELKLEDVSPETFNPDIDLVDEVGIDSMDLATVALVLRDEYTVRIDEDDYPKLTTVRLIGEYIEKKLAA